MQEHYKNFKSTTFKHMKLINRNIITTHFSNTSTYKSKFKNFKTVTNSFYSRDIDESVKALRPPNFVQN